jgi:vacuolar-type H+-ATPase subunit E/Vma4
MAAIIGSGLESYIKRHAREQALNQIAEAESQAARVLEQANTRVRLIEAETDENTQRQIAQNRRRLIARATLQARQALVERREALMATVWERVSAALRAPQARETRLALLERVIAQAAEQLGGGALEVQANAEDLALLTKALPTLEQRLPAQAAPALTLAAEPAPIWGGAIVRRLDTHEVVDNSLNQRLRLAQESLREQVFEWLTQAAPAPRLEELTATADAGAHSAPERQTP